MDSLQAALVKLDPATTVTPIGKILKVHNHRPAYAVDLDDNDLTLNNLLVNETMSKSSEILSKKKIIIPEDVDDNEKEDNNDNDNDDKQNIHILFDIVKKCSTLEPRRYNLNHQQQQQQQINIAKCTKTEVT